MPRFRLGVALLVPRPVADEIDGLRRACGEEGLARIAPHLTLVPPVNVREDRLDDALTVLRRAAATTRPFTVTLGPLTTFLPTNPVLYLGVTDNVDAVRVLRDRVFVEPLARTLTWPFHPHVTVRDGGEAEHLQAAAWVLCDYRAEVTFERVHLLREGRDDENRRVWRPLADAPFAAPAVIGRGGLELELTVTDALDPAGRAFQRREWAMVDHDRQGATLPRDLAVTARREGEVVGTAVGWTSGPRVHLGDLIVAAVHRRQGVGAHLVAGFLSEAIQRGCHRAWARTEAGGPAEAFWRRLGWIGEDRLEAYDEGRDFLQLRRDL